MIEPDVLLLWASSYSNTNRPTDDDATATSADLCIICNFPLSIQALCVLPCSMNQKCLRGRLKAEQPSSVYKSEWETEIDIDGDRHSICSVKPIQTYTRTTKSKSMPCCLRVFFYISEKNDLHFPYFYVSKLLDVGGW